MTYTNSNWGDRQQEYLEQPIAEQEERERLIEEYEGLSQLSGNSETLHSVSLSGLRSLRSLRPRAYRFVSQTRCRVYEAQ